MVTQADILTFGCTFDFSNIKFCTRNILADASEHEHLVQMHDKQYKITTVVLVSPDNAVNYWAAFPKTGQLKNYQGAVRII